MGVHVGLYCSSSVRVDHGCVDLLGLFVVRLHCCGSNDVELERTAVCRTMCATLYTHNFIHQKNGREIKYVQKIKQNS